MSVLEKLTEGIVNRDLQKEGDALLNKWEKTGLLEGLNNDSAKNGMAVLLENQAKELLREASSMAGGDVEGFAAVAFPIVRRVFGGLIANQLVSVQPMSLPSGLIFFLDFTYSDTRAGVADGESVYGGGVVASAIQTGVTDVTEEGGGLYNLQSGYSSPTGSVELSLTAVAGLASTAITALTDAQKKLLRFDPDLLAEAGVGAEVAQFTFTEANLTNANLDQLISLQESGDGLSVGGLVSTGTLVRRLTENAAAGGTTATITVLNNGGAVGVMTGLTCSYAIADNFTNATATGGIVGADPWGLEGSSNQAGSFDGSSRDVMPEIDIKVDSVAVTAITKKLKAKWTPELAQDLNAYHNMDAEVELTSILSEQIALEIDREILNDLVQGATAATYYWSRRPGRFIDRGTGNDISTDANEGLLGADFTGTVSEWYETLIETINDVSARIHVKTLRGGANFLVCSPEAANLLEFTAGFRAAVTADAEVGQAGAVKIGAISKKWDVYVDPYFPRNVVLVGRKGSSFLESGYVYAPYVPLQVTPTIFGVEDFVPRKGVMTRYAKKMVRPDAYGLVIIKDFLG
jgi:hypothetical protein